MRGERENVVVGVAHRTFVAGWGCARRDFGDYLYAQSGARDRRAGARLAAFFGDERLGAKILADNLHAVAILAAQEENPLPLEYKINRTYAFALLKRCLPRWLLSDTPILPLLKDALCLLTQQLIRFIPLASKPRPQRPKSHRKHAYKSVY